MDPRLKAALAALFVAGAAAAGITIPGDEEGAPPATTEETSTRVLPPAEEAAAIGAVLAAIESGAPLPYEEDGGVFQNREGLLPARPFGYYREYTVETAGSPDRGARRLVIGEGGETYYTDDHYASFDKIEPKDYR